MSRTGRSTLMLRTTVHQNANKPKSSEDCLWPIFLPFYVNFVSFFSFFCQDANKIVSNFAIISCNLLKKDKLAMYKTQGGEPNYVDHKFFFNILLGATYTKTKTSKYYRAG